MNDLQAMLSEGLAWVRSLGLGTIEKSMLIALATASVFHVGVWAVERLTGTRNDEYRSRDYVYDLAYWFYYRGGLNYALLLALLFPAPGAPVPWLDLGLLNPYPFWVQVVVFFLVSDLYAYAMHRLMHRFEFLWAFHSMHHVPERVTFAASARFHPIEILLFYAGYSALIRISGSNPLVWLPVLAFMEIMLNGQHTRIPWRLGPLYRVFVTPTFHRFHHSTDPKHYDHNFGAVLSVWDHLFGTALKQRGPWPEQLGVDGIRHATLLDTVLQPFAMAFAPLRNRRRGRAAPAGDVPPAT